jgi:hypothetical protein
MGLAEGSDRKRKVTELFGDISDIELEDLDSLDNPWCKWTSLRPQSTSFLKEANTFYCEIQQKLSLYVFSYYITCAVLT